jgi:hypothetical protein
MYLLNCTENWAELRAPAHPRPMLVIAALATLAIVFVDVRDFVSKTR